MSPIFAIIPYPGCVSQKLNPRHFSSRNVVRNSIFRHSGDVPGCSQVPGHRERPVRRHEFRRQFARFAGYTFKGRRKPQSRFGRVLAWYGGNK